jgi:hypothetical protein
LVIFEEHPDGGVIYCTCSCIAEAERTNEDRRGKSTPVIGKLSAPPMQRRATDATAPVGSYRCEGCGALLSFETDCPCGRYTAREAPEKLQRPDWVVITPSEPESSGSLSLVTVSAVGVVLVAALAGFLAWDRDLPTITAAPRERTFTSADDVKVSNDASGAVTLVSGSDPRSVFRAFCRHPQFNYALVPGGIEPTDPPHPDRLVGSALLMDGSGTLHRVTLQRNPKTNRWSIGDGTSAVALEHASPAAAASLH